MGLQLELLDTEPAWVIYVLCDPRTEDPILRIRYVGVTRRGVAKRLEGHIYGARKGEHTHKATWIRGLLLAGLTPLIEAIEPGTTEQAWDGAEVSWIKHFRDKGCPLTNGTDGGEGVRPTSETSRKMTNSQQARWAKPEMRAKQEEVYRRDDVRAKHSEDAKRAWADPEHRALRIAAMKAAAARPEVKAKKSEAVKVAWTRPEVRSRHKEAETPEVHSRRSASGKAAWDDSIPGMTEKKKALMKAHWATRKGTATVEGEKRP